MGKEPHLTSNGIRGLDVRCVSACSWGGVTASDWSEQTPAGVSSRRLIIKVLEGLEGQQGIK